MSTTIDQRVVEMKFDNKNFESNVKTSMSTLDKLKASLNFKGANAFSGLNKAVSNVNMSGLSSAVDNVSGRFSALETVAVGALMRIGSQAANLGLGVIKSLTIDPVKMGFQEYETQINAVQTILANTSAKGSTLQDVNKALDELNLYADKTIYNFTEMTRNIGTFTAAGVDLDTSVSAIKGIANLAAVSGSTSQQASTAMYQLSQALASGTVKLMDWNSVVNAGMGGQVFQDALKETARLAGVDIDAMIKLKGSFRETLAEGWLTSEILTDTLQKFTGDLSEADLAAQGYTDSQIKQIMELGQMANDAATKVKTFSQLVDTTKEAVQSGWTETFEILMGDFEEAKAMYTEIGNSIGDIVSSFSEARNSVLREGLSSGWKQLLNEGIDDEEMYISEITKVAEENGLVIEDLIKEYGSFEGVLKSGKITSDMLSDGLSNMTAKLTSMTEEEMKAAGYTNAQIETIVKLNDAVQDGTISMDEYLKKIQRMSGRENIFEGLKNIATGFGTIIKPILDALGETFQFTGDMLYELTERFKNFTAGLKLSETGMSNLKDAFKGVFSVAKLIGSVFRSIVTALFPATRGVNGFVEGLLAVAGTIGRATTAVVEFIEQSGVIQSIGETVGAVVGAVSEILGELIERLGLYFGTLDEFAASVYKYTEPYFNAVRDAIANFISMLNERFNLNLFTDVDISIESVKTAILNAGTALNQFKDNLVSTLQSSKIFSTIASVAESMAERIRSAFSTIGEGLRNAKITVILEGIGKALAYIWDAAKKAGAAIRDAFIEAYSQTSGFESDDVTKFVDALSFGGLVIVIYKVSKALKTMFDGMKSFKGEAIKVLTGVKDTLEAYQNNLKAQTLKEIAIAVGILAGAIAVLSFIEPKRLYAAAGALSAIAIAYGLFQKLMASSKKATQVTDPIQGILGIFKNIETALTKKIMIDALVEAIIGIAVSILIIASAVGKLTDSVKELGAMNKDELTQGLWAVVILLGAITIAVGALVTATLILSKKCDDALPDAVKGISSLAKVFISIALAIVILAAAVKILGEMDSEAIAQGLFAVISLIIILAITVSMMKGINPGSAAPIFAMALAISMLIPPILIFSLMPLHKLCQGLGTLAFALVSMGAAVKLMGSAGSAGGAGSILALALALNMLIPPIVIFSKIDIWDLAKGIGAMTASLYVLVVAVRKIGGIQNMSGAASIAILAASLTLLVVPIKVFSTMNWGEVTGGLLKMAAALAVLVGIGMAASAASAGLTSLGIACLSAGASIFLIGAGLVLIAGGLALLAKGLASSIDVIIDSLTPLLPKLTQFLIDLGESIIQVIIELGGPLADAILVVVIDILDALIKYTPEIIAKLLEWCKQITDGLAGQISYDDFNQLIASLTAALLGLKLWAILGAQALVGAGFMAALIAEIALIVAAFGGLAQIPGAKWIISEGGNFLQLIGEAIGKFVGGIVGGAASAFSDSLPNIGTNLSTFATNVSGFIGAFSNMEGAMTALENTKALAGSVGAIVEIVTKYGASVGLLPLFASELQIFGQNFTLFSDSLSTINAENVTAAAYATQTLATVAKELPNSGGKLGEWFGENDIDTFGMMLVSFGENIVAYSNTVSGMDTSGVEASVIAGTALSELASTIPNSGGILGEFFGNNDMNVFGEQLKSFGSAIVTYANTVWGIDTKGVEASVIAGNALSALADTIPNSGGVLGAFFGENDMNVFGEHLKSFGSAIVTYANTVWGIDDKGVKASVKAGEMLVNLAETIPNSGGLLGDIFGENDLGTFATQIKSFGDAMAGYSTTMEAGNFNGVIVSASAIAGKSLAELLPYLDGFKGGLFSDQLDLDKFGKQLPKFGEGMAAYSTSLSEGNFNAFIVTASSIAGKALAELLPMLDGMKGGLFSDQLDLDSFGKQLPKFGTGMAAYSVSLSEGNFDAKLVTDSATSAQALLGLYPLLEGQGSGLFKFFSGELSLSGFGTQLPLFGAGMAAYSNALAEGNFNAELANSSIYSAKALVGLGPMLEGQGSALFNFFSGETSLAEFGGQIVLFGAGMAAYSKELVKGEFNPELVDSSVNSAHMLAGLLPLVEGEGTEGVFSFLKKTPLESFAGQIQKLAQGMVNYQKKLVEGEFDADIVNAATASAQMIAGLIPMVENENAGGFFAFLKQTPLESFSTQIGYLADGLVGYSKKLSDGFNVNAVAVGTSAVEVLSGLIEGIPSQEESGGFFGLFAQTDMEKFSSGLIKLGGALAGYSLAISQNGVNLVGIGASIEALQKVVDLAKGLVGIDTSQLGEFSTNLRKLGENGIKSFVNTFKKADKEAEEAIQGLLTACSTAATNKQAEFSEAFKKLIEGVLTALRAREFEFYTAGQVLVDKMITGTKTRIESFRTAIKAVLSAGLSAAKNMEKDYETLGVTLVTAIGKGLSNEESKNKMIESLKAMFNDVATLLSGGDGVDTETEQIFYRIGADLVNGLISGMNSKKESVQNTAASLAKTAGDAMKRAAEIKSPSKVTYRLGEYFAMGFTNALENSEAKTELAARSLGTSAINGFNIALNKLIGIIDGTIDTTPVIKPVLDLSDVESKIGRLNAIFSSNKAMSINSSMFSGDIQEATQAGTNGTNITFNQNNYSPKALSRLEIYRQTQNQLLQAKGWAGR